MCRILFTLILLYSTAQIQSYSYPDVVNIVALIGLWFYFFNLKLVAVTIFLLGITMHLLHG